jgi:hypothetical protein
MRPAHPGGALAATDQEEWLFLPFFVPLRLCAKYLLLRFLRTFALFVAKSEQLQDSN